MQADEKTDFQYLEQEVFTNSSTTSHEVALLQPYTVYSFKISAVNSVGKSKPSRNSYPAITLRESKSHWFGSIDHIHIVSTSSTVIRIENHASDTNNQ